MQDPTPPEPRFVFPRWANYLLPGLLVVILGGGTYFPVLFAVGGSPRTTDVGYAPEQPIAFSHAQHVGKLGLDCRYCHTTVEEARFAALPPTQTCLSCHSKIKADSPELLKVRESALTGKPIEWVRVHHLPEYSYFNHAAHVNRGVSCVSCHGRIDQMDVVTQVEPLSMGWCLDCHRNPEPHLRPRDEITNLAWQPPTENRQQFLSDLAKEYGVRGPAYMTSCSTCHR